METALSGAGPSLSPYQLAPHACSAVQLVAVWSDQAVGPSGFPDGDGMISPAVLTAVALRLRNAVWGETHCTDVRSRPGGTSGRFRSEPCVSCQNHAREEVGKEGARSITGCAPQGD